MSFHFGIGNSFVLNCLLNYNLHLRKTWEIFSPEHSNKRAAWMSGCWASWSSHNFPLSLVAHCCLHITHSVLVSQFQKNILFFLWISTGDCPHSAICAMSGKAQLATLIRFVTQVTDVVCTLPFRDNKANYLSFMMIGNIMWFFVLLQSLDLMAISLLIWL